MYLGSILKRNTIRTCIICKRRLTKATGGRDKPPWKLLFFGTDSFSLEHVKALKYNMETGKEIVQNLEVVIPSSKVCK